MKMTYAFLLIVILFTFTNCTDHHVGQNIINTTASTRENKNLEVEIETTTEGYVMVNADEVTITYTNGSTFAVYVDSLPAYTATYVNVLDQNGKIKITSPSTAYTNKANVAIDVFSSALRIAIDPGSIMTSGTQIIIEDNNGL